MKTMILERTERLFRMAILILCVEVSINYVSEVRSQELIKPTKVSLLAGEGELWHSSESGTDWQRQPTPGRGHIEALITDPQGLGRLLLCQEGVVWMSNDKGLTWDLSIFDSEEEQGVAAAFHPELRNVFFLATNRRLLISTNSGKDWVATTPGLQFKWRPLSILMPGGAPEARIYITTRGDGMYRSDNDGQSWTAINTGLPKGIGAAPVAPIESAVFDPTDSDVVYVAAEAVGIYKTIDGGRTWVKFNRGLPGMLLYRTSPWVLAIDASNPQRLLLWASWPVNSDRVDSTFFLSEDGATTWRKVEAGGQIYRRVFTVQFLDAKVGLAVATTEDDVVLLSN